MDGSPNHQQAPQVHAQYCNLLFCHLGSSCPLSERALHPKRCHEIDWPMLRSEGYVLRQARHCESLSDPTLFYVKTLQMRCPDRQVDVVPPWLAGCGQQGHPQPTSQSGTTCNCMPAGAEKLRYTYTVWHMTEPAFWPDSMVSVKQLTCCNRLSAGLQEVNALGKFTELAGRF